MPRKNAKTNDDTNKVHTIRTKKADKVEVNGVEVIKVDENKDYKEFVTEMPDGEVKDQLAQALDIYHELDGIQACCVDGSNVVHYLSDIDEYEKMTTNNATATLDEIVAKSKKRVKLNKLEAFDEFIKAGVYSNAGGMYELVTMLHKFLRKFPKEKQGILRMLEQNSRLFEYEIIKDYDYEPHDITKTTHPTSVIMAC